MIPGVNPLQAASNQMRQQLRLNRQAPSPLQAAETQHAIELEMQRQGQELRASQGHESQPQGYRDARAMSGGVQGDLQAEQQAVQQHADEQAMQHAYQQAEPHLQALAPNHPLNILVHHLARRAYEASQGY